MTAQAVSPAPETAPSRPRARVVLVAGASGSGKTRLARRTGVPTVALDDFYREADDPVVTARYPGTVDWDDPLTWDGEEAAAALAVLCHEGAAELPVYDIPTSRRTGVHRVRLDGARVVVAEGIFAAELVEPLARRLLLAGAVCLRRNRTATFARRLARDLVEGRKSPGTLVRRGVRLARAEPVMLRRWQRLGCVPASRDGAHDLVSGLAVSPEPPAACLNTRVDLLAHLRGDVTRVAARIATARLDAPVPACPGWTAADLVEHLGGVYQWARVAVTERRGDGQPTPAPREPAALAAWFRSAGDDLLEALAGADAADPAWTMGEPRTAAFWVRRMAHETAIHAWDLWASQGATYPLDRWAAADGVDEVVRVMWPRQVRKGRAEPSAQAVTLASTDTGRRWVLGDPGEPAPTPVATVHAPAATLLLLLWGRAGLDDELVRVAGDRSAAADILARAVMP